MNDGELEPDSDVEMDDVKAAEKRYDEASLKNKEAAWLELWQARDFTWQGRSEKAMLQTEMVEVPASFPNGREVEGEFKKVSLQDYWRWSVGLPGEERLLTDEEMRQAGLLVEVDDETYHLIHAPHMGLKTDDQGTPLQILTDVVGARAKRVPEDIRTDANGSLNFARALQLRGGWLPGGLLRHTGSEAAIHMSGARLPDMDLNGMKVGPLNCVRSLFTDKANFESATFSGGANFESATFSGGAVFFGATFAGRANFRDAIFNCRSDFGQAKFSDIAVFDLALFVSMTNFERSTFGSAAGFESTFFGHPWTFKNSTFEEVANFAHAFWPEENSPNSFKGARFKDRVFFESYSSIPVSAFNEAHFAIPPSFADPRPNELDRMFRKAIWQTMASIKQARKAQAVSKSQKMEYKGLTTDGLLEALEGGFRTLSRVADNKEQELLGQYYYLLEIRARVRRPVTPIWEKIIAVFYDVLSSFGLSIARPVNWFAFTIAGFAVIYLALAIQVDLVDWKDSAALQSGFLQSLDFSLKNVFRPLSALSTEAPREGEAIRLAGKLLNNYGDAFGLIVTAISIVQSLTGIVLAFLFGLAVRRRFQIS